MVSQLVTPQRCLNAFSDEAFWYRKLFGLEKCRFASIPSLLPSLIVQAVVIRMSNMAR